MRIKYIPPTLQRKSHLYIAFLGIARPQPQFPHSFVCERCQDRSTYFLQQNRQTNLGKHVYKWRTDASMWKLGLRPRYSFPGNICFEISVFCLCSVHDYAAYYFISTTNIISQLVFAFTGRNMFISIENTWSPYTKIIKPPPTIIVESQEYNIKKSEKIMEIP